LIFAQIVDRVDSFFFQLGKIGEKKTNILSSEKLEAWMGGVYNIYQAFQGFTSLKES
jgi:hypothetical protein